MKKAIILLLFLCPFLGKSQSLTNTEWFGTNPPSINLYFYFGTDTLSYSTSSSGFTPLSLFTATNGQFAITDLSGSALCVDTGFYSYAIQGNTLSFTLIADNCASRRNTLTNYSWTRVSTTGQPTIESRHLNIRLIQSGSDGVFIISGEQILNGKMEFTVYSTSGKIQIHDFSDNSERKIDLSQLAEGIYFVAIRTNDGVYSQKILR